MRTSSAPGRARGPSRRSARARGCGRPRRSAGWRRRRWPGSAGENESPGSSRRRSGLERRRSRVAMAFAWPPSAGRGRPRTAPAAARHEAHLAGELHAQLAQVDHAVDAVRVDHDDGLGAEQAVLGAAEAQDVDAGIGRERAERDAQRGGRVPDARPVQVQRHAVGVRVVGDGRDLGGRVQRAEFGGLRDAHGERLRAVLVAPSPRLGGDQLGGELAVGRRAPCSSFRPVIFSGAPPSSVWMCAVLVATTAPQRGSTASERDDVRPGAVEHRKGLGAVAELHPHDLVQALGVEVFAVADLVAAVGIRQRGRAPRGARRRSCRRRSRGSCGRAGGVTESVFQRMMREPLSSWNESEPRAPAIRVGEHGDRRCSPPPSPRGNFSRRGS